MILPINAELWVFFFGFYYPFPAKRGISWGFVLSLASLQHSGDLDEIKCIVARFIIHHKSKIIHHPVISTLTGNISASLQGFGIRNVHKNMKSDLEG